MKQMYSLVVLIAAIAFGSCNKNNQSREHVNGKILTGKWELRAVSGGMLPFNPGANPPGKRSLWRFTKTEFAKIFQDSTYRSGTYSIKLGGGTDLNTGRKIDQFIFNNQPAESFELRKDTLRFYYGAIPLDGAIEMYVKISDNP